MATQTTIEALLTRLHDYARLHPTEDKASKRSQLLLRKKELLLAHRSALKQTEATVIRNLQKIDWDTIQPALIFASAQTYPQWVYLRMIASSAPYTGRPGRMIRMFCVDATSKTPLGVIELGSDLQSLKPRDDWIGWSHDEKYHQGGLQKVANVSTCVPIQPFGVLCGGKFMADSLITDDERSLAHYWRVKYGDPLALLTITSLYGKSSMYNRLPTITFLGTTMGLGTSQLTQADYDLLKAFALSRGRTGRQKNRTFLTTSRNDLLDVVCSEFKIDRKQISTSTPKGVYIAPLVTNPRGVLTMGEEPVQINRTMRDAQEYYRQRWYEMRLRKTELRDQLTAFDPESYRVDAQIELCDG